MTKMNKMIIDMNRGKVFEDIEVRVKTDSNIITGFQFKVNDTTHDIRLGWFDRVKQRLGKKLNMNEIEFISIFDIGYKVAFKNSSIISYNIQ